MGPNFGEVFWLIAKTRRGGAADRCGNLGLEIEKKAAGGREKTEEKRGGAGGDGA